jgi:hypothetical protein
MLRILSELTHICFLLRFLVLQADRKQFETRVDVQLELLHSIINKTLYTLLLEQQSLLTKLKFPQFTKEHFDIISKKYDAPRVSEILSKQKRLVGSLVRLAFHPAKGNTLLFTESLSFRSKEDVESYYSLEAKMKRRKRATEGSAI